MTSDVVRLADHDAKFWTLVAKDSVFGCWNWLGYLAANGYAEWSIKNKKLQRVYRWSFQRFKGPIPAGLTIDHLCRNPRCVNPDHLEAVTHQENCRRAGPAQVQRRTHCPSGHAFSPDNTWVWRGARICIACEHARKARQRERKRQQKVIA